MTIKEIAKLAEVSPATVSRVLNHSAVVKEETRKRVLQILRDYDYKPAAAVKTVGNQSSYNNIGLFVPDMDNPFFISVVKGITQIADKYHSNVFLFNTDETPEREHRFLKIVQEQNLRGIIMIPLSSSDDESEESLRQLEKNGIPVVLVDRRIGNFAFDSVFTDDVEDSARAVEALIKEGHKKIATITGFLRSTSGAERLQGYEMAMNRHHLEIRPEYVERGNFKYQKAYEAATRLLNQKDMPTAIFTANNMATLAALHSAIQNHLTVGKDISILGFDEIARWQWYPLLSETNLGLSLVERPVMQMAEEAMELLQSRIVGKRGSDHAKRRIVLSNRIVLRGSEQIQKMKGGEE